MNPKNPKNQNKPKKKKKKVREKGKNQKLIIIYIYAIKKEEEKKCIPQKEVQRAQPQNAPAQRESQRKVGKEEA